MMIPLYREPTDARNDIVPSAQITIVHRRGRSLDALRSLGMTLR